MNEIPMKGGSYEERLSGTPFMRKPCIKLPMTAFGFAAPMKRRCNPSFIRHTQTSVEDILQDFDSIAGSMFGILLADNGIRSMPDNHLLALLMVGVQHHRPNQPTEDGISLPTLLKATNVYRRSRQHDFILDFLPPSVTEFQAIFGEEGQDRLAFLASRNGEEFKLFWPDQPEFVRMAARFGAKIVPFGTVGEDDIAEEIANLFSGVTPIKRMFVFLGAEFAVVRDLNLVSVLE
ncbi:hypothetical protein ACLOJK_026038 [Asimina triloba]